MNNYIEYNDMIVFHPGYIGTSEFRRKIIKLKPLIVEITSPIFETAVNDVKKQPDPALAASFMQFIDRLKETLVVKRKNSSKHIKQFFHILNSSFS